MSQWSDGTCKEQEKIVFIPEVKSIEEGKDVAIWLVLVGLEGIAEGTKDDCWSKDTRWTYCLSQTSLGNRRSSFTRGSRNGIHSMLRVNNIRRSNRFISIGISMFLVAILHSVVVSMAKGAIPRFLFGLRSTRYFTMHKSFSYIWSINQNTRIFSRNRWSKCNIIAFFLNHHRIHFVYGWKRIHEKNLSLQYWKIIIQTSEKLNHLIFHSKIASSTHGFTAAWIRASTHKHGTMRVKLLPKRLDLCEVIKHRFSTLFQIVDWRTKWSNTNSINLRKKVLVIQSKRQ